FCRPAMQHQQPAALYTKMPEGEVGYSVRSRSVHDACGKRRDMFKGRNGIAVVEIKLVRPVVIELQL
ncbi:MAG: hypothetical protein AAFN03_10495, partial [Pseudomonadota bacterium]